MELIPYLIVVYVSYLIGRHYGRKDTISEYYQLNNKKYEDPKTR